MLAVAKYLPAARNYLRQIVPPVLATLIAALLIAGFNRAFTTHLVQPRMAALHSNSDEAVPPAGNAVKPREAIEIVSVSEPAAPERVFVKDNDREAGKDQTIKVAAPAAPAPVTAAAPPAAPRIAVRKVEPPVVEQRLAEPRVAAVPVVVAPSVMVAPAPVLAPPVVAQPIAPLAPAMQPAPMMQPVAQEPPPVIAAKPMVTVPDRTRPAYEPPSGQDLAQAPAPRQESFVEALRPSSIFNRMREFGERIEAAGNEILPTIRQ
jgi:hypothetical protein